MSTELVIISLHTDDSLNDHIISLLPDVLKDIPRDNIDIINTKYMGLEIYIHLYHYEYIQSIKYLAVYRTHTNILNTYNYNLFHSWLLDFCYKNSVELYLI